MERITCSSVVVSDQVHIKVFWRLGFDAAQEPEPFLMAMSLHTLADHPAGGDIECCEQRRCPVAFVVVRHGAASAFLDRQAGLRSVQRLDLAFFVDREHQCLVRRVEIEADNIPYFLDEALVAFDSLKVFTRCGLSSWSFQMQTPAFTDRPRTPWGQKISPSVIGKNLTPIVGEQIYPDGIEMPERGMAPVLQSGRMSVPAEVDAEWNAWYCGEYVPGYRKVSGVIYARRYRVLEGTSGYSTVYELASTAVPKSSEWKEQQQHSSLNSPRMRQTMTHARVRPGCTYV